jgi:acyl dehydratase/phosphotransacetylase
MTDTIENHPFDEIHVGDGAHLCRTLQAKDIQLFAAMSGDVNPAHVDPEYAQSTPFHGIIAHGMWGAALISTVIGTEFPGPGTIYMGQSLRFVRPVHIGDTVDVRVTVSEMDASNRHVTLACRCTNQKGEDVITGSALVLAPSTKVSRPRVQTMQVELSDKAARYHQLLGLTKGMPPISMALVHPVSIAALLGARAARDEGLILPMLIGPPDAFQALAEQAKVDLLPLRIVPAADELKARVLAEQMAQAGDVQALMLSSLHEQAWLSTLIKPDGDAPTNSDGLSHVSVVDLPHYPRPLLIGDAVWHTHPDLATQRRIVRHAVAVAHAIGISLPKVAILAAEDDIALDAPNAQQAAALCKMAERGQITGAVLDGPLALDSAPSPQAACNKGIQSAVAGMADILIPPDLGTAQLMAQQMRCLSDAQFAAVLMGAVVPIVISEPDAPPVSTLASCALAMLLARAHA